MCYFTNDILIELTNVLAKVNTFLASVNYYLYFTRFERNIINYKNLNIFQS